MIRVDAKHLAAIEVATRPEDLHEVVRQAVRLEFSTIPPYLTAMMSLAVEANREIWSIIHSVVVEEMLHRAIMCNLLNALGGDPAIDAADFLPDYPGPLPLSVDDGLVVGLERFSPDLVQRTFMAIEEPDHPIVLAALAAAPPAKSIGDFYRALKAKVLTLPDAAFAPRNQFTAPQWFPAERLFALRSAADAARAIDLIVVEGEGTTVSPLDDEREAAHYYRFQQIVKGRYLARGADGKLGFNGAAIPYEPAQVFPITSNQRLSGVEAGSQAFLRASQFAYSFTKLLAALQATFNGQGSAFSSVLSLMFELKLNGRKLCGTPLTRGGQPTGDNCGPCFERVPIEAYA